jgi:hypothetical protein
MPGTVTPNAHKLNVLQRMRAFPVTGNCLAVSLSFSVAHRFSQHVNGACGQAQCPQAPFITPFFVTVFCARPDFQAALPLKE